MQTTMTPAAVSVNLTAARFPSRTASSAIATASAGHAVAFMDAETPSARPALTGSGCHRYAKPRHRNATIGTSSPPVARLKAITGQPATSTVQRAGSFALARRSANQNTTTNARPNHIRGSVTALSAIVRGTPKSDITGRYGLYAFGLVVEASAAAPAYGMPWWMRLMPDWATTATSGCCSPA